MHHHLKSSAPQNSKKKFNVKTSTIPMSNTVKSRLEYRQQNRCAVLRIQILVAQHRGLGVFPLEQPVCECYIRSLLEVYLLLVSHGRHKYFGGQYAGNLLHVATCIVTISVKQSNNKNE
jgi:hypothetical protein